MKAMIVAAGAMTCVLAFSGQANADPTLDPVAAAGKKIFEETAGGVGCKTCHGMDAKGDAGPDIRGRTKVDIQKQLKINEAMQFIKLKPAEIDQVEAYLTYLHDLEAH